MRHAELVLPASHLVEILLEVPKHQRHIFYFFLEVRRAPLLSRCSFRLAEALELLGADFRASRGLDLLPDLRWGASTAYGARTPSRRHVDGVDRSRLLHWKRTVRKNAIRRFLTLTQSRTSRCA